MKLLFMEFYSLITASSIWLSTGSAMFSSSTWPAASSQSMTSPNVTDTPVNEYHRRGSREQRLLRHISGAGSLCGAKEMPSLQRKLLKTSDVSCNDGSPAGYYIRRSPGSDRWIVFLEGGWYCFDHISCSERFRLMRDYMSSRNWPKYRSGSGILSWDPEENPYHFHSNVVYVPYCSSDSWSGTRNKTSVMDFSFMGSLILDKIIRELLQKGMKQSKTVTLAGTSAGGTGVLINLDQIADIISAINPNIKVQGIVDAGWFLDNEPFRTKPCRDSFTCSPMAGIQKGTRVWEPRLPANCTAQYPAEIWRCFFGHRVYPTVKSPVYIIQNLYDAAQIQVNNVFEERLQSQLTSEQWRYLLSLGEQMKETLQNVSAVFSPGCVSHEILTKPEWHKLRIEGISLPESIHCWETSQNVNSLCHRSSFSSNPLISKNDTPLSDESLNSQDKKKWRKKGKQKWRNGRKNDNRRNHNRHSRPLTRQCQQKLIDKCPWPHCNCSCIKSRWEVLSHAHQFFLKTLAAVMGIDPQKMINTGLCGS